MAETKQDLATMMTAVDSLRSLAAGCRIARDTLENAATRIRGGEIPSRLVLALAKDDGEGESATTFAGVLKRLERALRYEADSLAMFRKELVKTVGKAKGQGR